jgi:eukaryotic-like serine/threonine-protein kinase
MLGTILRSHYKIVKVLGIGKSGITYLAIDLDLIDSPLYVVKEIQDGKHHPVLPQLAEKIFEIQGTISHRVGQHPQVPALVANFVENGHRYLVREYIDGEFLSRELGGGGTWSQIQVFDFLMDLVGILSFVHSFQYIHQDINPHNIIRRSDDGRFNLIGFGSVKDVENTWHDIADDRHHNLDNSSYIPYEQEQNISQFNSDIYAVGTIAIQALTGKFPLDRDPDSYEFKWRDDVNINDKLIKIIDRMVRPDYRNRYQSALEVLADLQSFALAQIPVSKSHLLKPRLIFGAAACTLLLGFGIAKLLSASANKPQLSPPKVTVTKTLPVTTASSGVSWKIYTDKIAKIKIKYATTWQVENLHNVVTGENATFTSAKQSSADKYRENVSIRVENLMNPQMTLSNYTKSAISEIEKYYRGAKIIESSPTKLAKKPASLVVYTGKDENLLPIKNLEVWTIDRGKAYIVSYKAEPDRYYQFLETAMTMINSFELK